MVKDRPIDNWHHHPHTELMYSFALKHGAYSDKKRLAFYALCDKYQWRFKNSPPDSIWPALWEQSKTKDEVNG